MLSKCCQFVLIFSDVKQVLVSVQLVNGREVKERWQFEFISAAETSQVGCRSERLVIRAANSTNERTRKEGRSQMFSWSWNCRTY